MSNPSFVLTSDMAVLELTGQNVELRAEIARLRAALEQIETTAMSRPVYEIVYIARRALAKED